MKRYIETHSAEEFDLVVIGGGITGACVAYEASARGLKVALFEKADFGGATSAATSKLIHGGLRYLNYFEFGLVRESLRERRILEDIAPNLVYPLPFLIPTYHGLSTNRWVLKMGMILYDLLSFDKGWTHHLSKKLPHHHTISKEETLRIAPLLPADGLTGGQVYYDCQSMFPERLTLAFIKSAVAFGARVSNHAEVQSFERDSAGRIVSVSVKDRITSKVATIRGKLFVNSGGPWASRLIDQATGKSSGHAMRMSEGIHIIVPQITKEHALVLQTPGKRHFFLIPWRGKSLIGTTDKDYVGKPDDYRVSRKSIDEFIDEINGTFKRKLIQCQDIIHAYGGLRPLTDTHTESSYTSSRRYEIFDGSKEGAPGLITVEGGKYTTSRNLAANVMKVVEKNLGRKLPPSNTKNRQLVGCEMENLTDFLKKAPLAHPEFPATTVNYLARNFGTQYERVLELAKEKELSEPINADGEILAEVLYATRDEMARTLLDVITHRTGLGTLGLPGDDLLVRVAAIMGKELGWTAEKREEEIRIAKECLALPR